LSAEKFWSLWTPPFAFFGGVGAGFEAVAVIAGLEGVAAVGSVAPIG
jgi:hypothetical protein